MSKHLARIRLILAMSASSWVTIAAAQNNVSLPPNATSNHRVSGTVLSKTDGRPLECARVLLRDAKARKETQSLVTSQDGKFVFEDVSAGKYALEGTKRGFIPAGYDQHDQYSTAIVTGAGLETENLVLRLSPEAIISGRVLDEAGEPVRHAQVALYREDHTAGVDQIHSFRNSQTDDLGAYELTSLLPGTYFLSVHAQPWYAVHPPEPDHGNADGSGSETMAVDRSLDVAYPLTYYQNATEADGATPIQVGGGEHLQIEMHLNPVPALRLIFHVPVDQNQRFTMPQLEQTGFDGSTYIQATPRLVSPGVVEISGVPAGRYNVRIPGQNSVSRLNGIDLNKDGEEVDTSTAEAVGTVKISVTIPSENSIPKGLAVMLTQGTRTTFTGFYVLSAKGEVEIPQVMPGTYEVRVSGGNKPYVVVGLSADGAQVKGHAITVPAGASATVSLNLAPGVEVQGIAKKAGKPFPEAMVVLVPRSPEGNRDLFRRDQSDLDGTFSLRAVVPGSYTLVAIEDGWDLDWARPQIIAAYVKRGQPIVVGGDLSKPVQVKEAIEVQSK